MDLGSKEGTSKTNDPSSSASKVTNDPSSSSASKVNSNIAIAQYKADAKLHDEFEQCEESGKSFDYSKSIKLGGVPDDSVSQEKMVAYLSKIQSGGLIQRFGCTIAVEIPTFIIIAYSENIFDLLGIIKQNLVVDGFDLNVGSLLGLDARILFAPSSGDALARASSCREISILNPIWVTSRSSKRPFYAIVHRIGAGLVIDLEPAQLGDPVYTIAGAVQSQKLAVRAISRLQSLPGGDIGVLCDTIAENVQELTCYDRVMVYKFHEDEHGEVVSEIRKPDLEPYLGLHYPATDIPQIARFLFKQNRVRMIFDCHAKPVGIIQSEKLKEPLCLVNSTLRSPHDCHTQYMVNMRSLSSLVMAVVVNKNESTRLWGLVVCHHSSRRYIPFPLRYACEFLMQAFGLQLNMELQVAAQLAEKKILKMQTLLCDMLLRNTPDGIVTQSPNIMDLVKCDGAAMYFGGMCWLLGVTPTKEQIEDIANWLLTCHPDSTGLSTDSLDEAGYPGAALLGDEVCGMASARITSKDFLFWFRSHTTKEVKWGGAKHRPEDKDDDGRMHPRLSFKAFLDGVKRRSFPWEIYEMNGIHSLQLIMRRSFQDTEHLGAKAMIHTQLKDLEIQGMDKLSFVACDMVRLIATATTPILGVDSAGLINGWNTKVAELTGLAANDAMGKSLVNDLVYQESRTVVENHISRALQGDEDKNVELKLRTFGVKQHNEPVFILANACSSKDYKNDIVGVCFVGQNVTEEKIIMDKFVRLQADYKAIIQSHNSMIPPIFASDDNVCCCEWNAAMEKLTGWTKEEIIGKMLIGEIFGGFCQLKSQDALTKFMILIYHAIAGQETEKLPFAFFNKEGKYLEVLLTTNKRTDMSGKTIGCFCFLQEPVPVPDRDEALQVQRQWEKKSLGRLEELTYIGQEMKNSLNGIRFTHKLLETSVVSDEQKRVLETSEACERQLMTIIDDMELGSIEESRMKLNNAPFLLGSVMDVILSQVMILLREKNLQLIHDISEQIKTMSLYGDQIRLQQVLSVFLQNVVHHAPTPGGWVEIKVTFNSKLNEDGIQVGHLEFRMTHPGEGVPSEVIQDMFEEGTRCATHEGFRLSMSRKLLKKMNGGHVQYVKEPNKCYFLIKVEFHAT